jgi:hypothetical protein
LLKEKRFAMPARALSHTGEFGYYFAHTASSLVVPIIINRDWQWFAWVMAAVYAVLLSLLAASYKSTFGINID